MKGKEKIKRKTLHFQAMHMGKAYYIAKDVHVFFAGDWLNGEGWVICKTAPYKENPHITAVAAVNENAPLVPPADGWDSDKYLSVKIATSKPADWIEGDSIQSKERIAKLLAVMRKDTKSGGGSVSISIRDMCRHIDAVKQFVPELIVDFPKIDSDGDGVISLQELDDYFHPLKKKEFSQDKLDEIWRILTSKRKDASLPQDQIFLEDMAANMDFIDEKIPDLFEAFADIDTDKSCSVDRVEFDAFFGSADVWLNAKLKNIIGLAELKKQIETFYWSIRLDRLRRRAGIMVNNDEAIVMLFKGSPGTGKTTIGRLITGLLHKIDIIPTETFVECQRDELVGDHIGATEKLTEKKIAEAKGGVLFVDEAYRLNTDIFGVEAINCLMKSMTVKGRVIIVAGYPKQMDEFVTANPGLKRRITYEFTFPDYNADDLAKIFVTQVEKRGFQVDPAVSLSTLSGLIAKNSTPAQRTCFNGGITEHITRHAIFHLNESQVPLILGCKKGEEPTPSATLALENIVHGCKHIPEPAAETLKFAADARIRPGRWSD